MSQIATPAVRKLNRNIAIAGSVVILHIGALWALQTGLLRRTVEMVIPIHVIAEMVTPPAPRVEPPLPLPPPPSTPTPPPRATQPAARKGPRALPPSPRPAAPPEAPVAMPAPNAPTGLVEPQPVAPSDATTSTSESGPAAMRPGPGKVELPSSNASYLQNPAPVYPPISKRLGEQGKVVVRVLIGADGAPQRAELKHSSGYDRLDQAAIGYVMSCRYVPGKIGGVPQAMWYEAPVNFILQ